MCLPHGADKFEMALVLGDGGVDALSFPVFEFTDEFSSLVHLQIAYEVFTFDHKITLLGENKKIYLSRKSLVLQMEILQYE